MSDPVTNVEIEDVLSSIRRLVSNGQADRLDAGKAVSRETEAADRLVLTPALRVDDRAPGVESVTEAQQMSGPDADDVWDHTTALQADLEPEAHPEDHTPPEQAEAEQPRQDMPVDASPELSAQAAEFEALVAGRDDQWEPDGASDDDYAGDTSVSSLRWSEEESAQTAMLSDADEEPSSDPDWDEADDLTSERHVQDWQDAEETAARQSAADAELARGEPLLMDDAVLDEEALRDLVAEIVRQELQGALGERITRNVRKLVRREIHRALTSQDFD